MVGGLPGSVLFACSRNSIRSPMAEAYLKHLHRQRIFIDSAGVHRGEIDGFAIAAMGELGIDLTAHHAKSFDDLEESSFDLIVTLAPDAHHMALELTRTDSVEVEFWNTLDPSVVEGSREQRLEAFRQVRDALIQKIHARFPPQLKPA